MPGKFQWCKFGNCDLNDSFFDTLKEDYKEFPIWFSEKCKEEKEALVFEDEQGIGAFVYLKSENETIELIDKLLPAIPRIKIGTLRLAERYRGQRLGEGALGVALWRWQEEKCDEIYVTIYEKHYVLISLFERFGFNYIGMNQRGERIYLKSRKCLDYSNPYKAFPFIKPDFEKAGIIPVEDRFHDTLFPYSELYRGTGEIEEISAANGVTKVFVGAPTSNMHHKVGEPVIIYRKYTGNERPVGFRSVATSFCTIVSMTIVKSLNRPLMSVDAFVKLAGSKTIFDDEALRRIYVGKSNLVLLELLYNGYFGKGHNITYNELKNSDLFETYPYEIGYTPKQFKTILEMGDKDVQNVIID